MSAGEFLAISFSFKNNIQVLKFSEQLSQEEFSQVLHKLEEKIKKGRRLYLFHLEQFQNQDDNSKSKIVHLIKFCFQKELNLCLCLSQKYWPIYSSGTMALAKMFNTEAEGLNYLENLANGGVEKPLSASESKQKDTDDLLKKYEMFHKVDDLDPYHLKNMDQLYMVTPTIEAIENLEKATIDLGRRKENIVRLEAQCEEISRQVIDMSIARSQAIKDAEFELRKKHILEREAVVTSYQKIYVQKIADIKKELVELDDSIAKLTLG